MAPLGVRYSNHSNYPYEMSNNTTIVSSASPDSEGPEEFYSFDLVMDYLEGKLPERQKSRLKAALEKSEALEDYVDDVHDAWLHNPNLREDVDRESPLLMVAFTELAEQHPLPEKKPHWLRTWQSGAVAATALIAAVLTWWAYANRGTCQLSTPQLIEETGAYGQMATTQSEGGANDYSEAFSFYAQGDYAQAIPRFERLIDTTQNSETMREMTLSLGVAYLMTGQSQAAVPHLRRAQGFFQPRYQQQAAWYLALAYRDLGRTAEAEGLLQQLADRGQLHAPHAEQLLPCLAPQN